MHNTPQPQESLAEYVKRIRTSLSLSQNDLAMKAGIHLQSLGKIERGMTTKLNSKSHRWLAHALQVPSVSFTLQIMITILIMRIAATNAELVTKDCLSIKDNTDKYLECVRKNVNQSISLPLGWDKTNIDQQEEESKRWFWSPLGRFLGWIISGFAIMMGAPFWFELLGKIINVRNAGKPPEKSIDRQGTN